MKEERLHDLARRLGAREAERLDVDATARAVVERLKQAGNATERRWIGSTWLRVAAALVLLAGGGVLAREWLGPEPTGQVAAIPTGADLGALSSDQLEDLLDSLDRTLDLNAPALDSAGTALDDLTADELRAMLRALEG